MHGTNTQQGAGTTTTSAGTNSQQVQELTHNNGAELTHNKGRN
nr:hypothetical protein [Mycoplasmopsis bovis]